MQKKQTTDSSLRNEKQKLPYFTLTQDGETISFHGMESECRKDYEESKEDDNETETFFDWCKNSYDVYHHQQETNPKAIIGSGVEYESDYLRWFNSRKQTFTGINAGNYLDEEDFETYGRNAERTIQALRDSNAELLKALEDLSKMICLTDFAFTPENINAKAIIKKAKSIN